jgi:imidazoleglycerol-phosphate dehydratase
MSREATIKRTTAETDISLSLLIDGDGTSSVDTGIPFMDHMLTLFAKHGFYTLEVKAKGDLEVDAHHTIEDLGIVLGSAIKDALGDKKGIRRYGFFSLPMDETLVNVALDLSGRPYCCYNLTPPSDYINNVDTRLFNHFFESLTWNVGMNLHIDLIRGEDTHHVIEATFKAFAKALDMATQMDPRETGVPSTKGLL